jgi:chemotaxis protein MotA
MDLATLIGLAIGIGGLLGGFILEGGQPASLIGPTAALIVVGGTVGAAMIGHTVDDLKNLPKLFVRATKSPPDKRHELLQEMVDIAEMARRDGLLALENRQLDDPFLKRAVMLVIDGTDPETTRDILMMDIEAMEARHERGYGFFNAMGGYSPTMGIIGTVMGLIFVLGNLENPDELGHSIAVAFIATLYGVFLANIVYLPIGAKLKLRSKQEVAERTMVVEGTLAIQAGDNPRVLKEKLSAYIAPDKRNEKPAAKEAVKEAGASARAAAVGGGR